jgi:hypothetical protein
LSPRFLDFSSKSVTPAQAGVQKKHKDLDSRFRGNDCNLKRDGVRKASLYDEKRAH